MTTLAPRLIPLAGGLALAVPVVAFRYPPMGDLAFHEAAVSLLRHWGDPRFCPHGLYALNLGQPNQLFHALAYLLSWIVATDTACKLVVAGSTALFAYGAGELAAHLGVTRWAALLVAPIALGWMARWGLVANLLGSTLFILLLPPLDRAVTDPSAKRCAGSLVAVVLLFFAHESSMMLYALAALVLAVRAPRDVRSLGLALAPALLAGALAAFYAWESQHLKAPSIALATPVLVSPWARALGVSRMLYSVGVWSFPIFGLTLIVELLLIRHALWQDKEPLHLPLLVFSGCCLVLYLVFPEAALGSTLLYPRFLAPGMSVLLLALLPASPPPRWAPVLALAPALMLAASLHLFRRSDRSARDLDTILPNIEEGSAVAQLDWAPWAAGPVAPVVGEAARVLAVRGGRLLFSFTDAPTYPVTIPPERRWDEPVLRMVQAPFAFAPAYDFQRFRYALVWAPFDEIRRILVLAASPEGRLVAMQGSWMLFESTLPVDSITSPDRPLPSPPPETMAVRVRRIVATALP